MGDKIKKNITILFWAYFILFSEATIAQNNMLNVKYAEITNAELPRVLLIGNSVCKGYSKYVIDSFAGIANVDVWTTGANVAGSAIQKQLISVIRKKPYNVIHFNIGLHGLGNRIQQKNYALLMNKYVNTFSNYTCDSKLIWASITPVRIKGTAMLDTTAGRNNLIILRNKITGKIMSKRGIPTNDLYSLAVKNIELGAADGVHWTKAGYKFFAAQITKVIKQTLKTGAVTKQVLPTYKNVKYGTHKRNVLNFWKAKSDKPTPVVIKIHGGGWAAGSKSETILSDYFLQDGISVVAISYRLINTDMLPAPVYDAARALQFVRSKAKEWNIDKERIAVTGGSAGGCTSLWLTYHDNLADPENSDPVLRESTKPFCAAVESAQSCLDPFIAQKWIGDKVIENGMFWKAVGAKSPEDLMENYDKYKAISHEFSPYFHIDKNDPPVFLINHNPLNFPAPSGGLAIHHPMFVFKVKEKADKVGCEAQLILRRTRQQNYYDSMDFIKSKLLNR